MDFKEIKIKSEAELNSILQELRNKVADLKFKDAQKQLKNVRELRQVKKNIAQVLTVLNSKKQTADSSKK